MAKFKLLEPHYVDNPKGGGGQFYPKDAEVEWPESMAPSLQMVPLDDDARARYKARHGDRTAADVQKALGMLQVDPAMKTLLESHAAQATETLKALLPDLAASIAQGVVAAQRQANTELADAITEAIAKALAPKGKKGGGAQADET